MSTTEAPDTEKRDFLYIATGSVAAVGAGFIGWMFVDQMNPDASVRALASVDFDLAPVAEGQSVVIKWRGNPVIIRHRTAKEIEEGKAVKLEDLRDTNARNVNLKGDAQASDQNRALKDKEQFLIMLGVCTHLGCVPIGNSGDYDGWFCPCHGSHYDTAGRIRKGPAPENLHVPPLKFVSDTIVQIG